VPSDGPKSSVDQHSFIQDMCGLPEYDYPAPWSIKQEYWLPEIEYPVPLVVMKNTFVDFDVWRPPSLEEFYKERHTQSCPVSGIGLEEVFEPDDATANLVAAAKLIASETALREASMMGLTEAKATQLPMDHLLPSGLLDDIPIKYDETQSLWPPAPLQAQPAFDTNWKFSVAFAPLYEPVSDIDWRSQASKQPVVLDLAQALCSPLPIAPREHVAQGPPFFAYHLATPSLEPELGSLECPTVGSQAHCLGTCRPCAFFHTRGCGNGILCPFCHLCGRGEKKKRAKDKRVVHSSHEQP